MACIELCCLQGSIVAGTLFACMFLLCECTVVEDINDVFVPADLERFEGWWCSGLGVLAGQKPFLE